MKIDLHVHTKTGSDGALTVEDVIEEAARRGVGLLSITDHDSIECQSTAVTLAGKYGIAYVTGVELNVTFEYGGKPVSLDFLGYRFDTTFHKLVNKLRALRERREERAHQIMQNLNAEFDKERIEHLTEEDFLKIQQSVDGSFGRPHIANYLIKKGIVKTRQEAFDKYLVKCDVPKYPLALSEASMLVRNAGGVLVLAHPGDPNGTSLVTISSDLNEQTAIIERHMLSYIDGIECWHPRHDERTVSHYTNFATKHRLIMTGGSDCHQKPVLIGTVPVPDFVASFFRN
ncbi:MAG: PHP domain-containing protein [Chloroflexi bacterium]|nr:PHP domain-containing protein [Chloroflexota bacterium]